MQAAEWPWPEDVVLDPAKQPRFVTSVDEFFYELQYGCHMDQVVVFPDGVRLLGQQDVVHPEIATALALGDDSARARNAYEVLERLERTGLLDAIKGKVTYQNHGASRREATAGGSANACMRGKWEALQRECPRDSRSSVYCAELRLLKSYPVENGLRSKRKSTLRRTMRECVHESGVDVRKMLFWDDFSEGFFVGGHLSGYDLHTDCIPTSNVGSVFSGHKLLAIWDAQDGTRRIMRDLRRELFVPPLGDDLLAGLGRACCIAMAPPGSVYIFSGTNAHAVCNVGFSSAADGATPERCLCVSSYEAFVGLHREHADVLVRTCNGADSDSDEDIVDFEEEVALNVRTCVRSMKESRQGQDEVAQDTVEHVLATSSRISRCYEEEVAREERALKSKRRRVAGDSRSSTSPSSSPGSDTSDDPAP